MTDSITNLKKSVESYNNTSQKITLKENEMLSRHSTFRIGGPARLFGIPSDTDALIFLLDEARRCDIETRVVGNGSNILFDDAGFDGLIISTSAMNSVKFDGTALIAECGAMLSACAVQARDRGLSGLECLYGIPGTIGGAVYMNAGAYGGEISDLAVKTTYLDPESMTVRTVTGEEHKFAYRHSIFKENGGIILKTELSLKTADKDTITAAMDDYKGRRADKQPLEFPSAGSTFKRSPGRYTGQMIDECGLKGFAVGGAQVSEKHAGFVINRGGATSADVLALIEHIKDTISKNYGIEIETEIIHVK